MMSIHMESYWEIYLNTMSKMVREKIPSLFNYYWTCSLSASGTVVWQWGQMVWGSCAQCITFPNANSSSVPTENSPWFMVTRKPCLSSCFAGLLGKLGQNVSGIIPVVSEYRSNSCAWKHSLTRFNTSNRHNLLVLVKIFSFPCLINIVRWSIYFLCFY